MQSTITVRLWGLLALMVSAAAAAELPRPAWHDGDQWIVVAETHLSPAASDSEKPNPKISWRFQVAGHEKAAGRPCVRLIARAQNTTAHTVTLWCDDKTGSLVRIRATLPAAGKTLTFEESYEHDRPVSVMPSLTALPCELPAFFTQGKGIEQVSTTFRLATPPTANEVVSPSLAFEVSQTTSRTSAGTKELAGTEVAKGINQNDEIVEVTLESGSQRIEQWWHAGHPWPLVSNNGSTTARLVSFTPAPVAAPRTNPKSDPGPEKSDSPPDSSFQSKALTRHWAVLDSGRSEVVPWSGYWWPHRTGGLAGPLTKYDRVTGSAATAWEKSHHAARRAAAWHGHCHAWAAASILEQEPKSPREFKEVFSVGEQKGLLTALHGQDISNTWGDRFGDRQGSENSHDLAPGEVWRLLRLHLAQNHVPIIFDLEPGPEVWNYPVLRYEVQGRQLSNQRVECLLRIWVARNDVPVDSIGTRQAVKNYQFQMEHRDAQFLASTGRWSGTSLNDHPDFAWYPWITASDNPEISAERVTQIIGSPVGELRNSVPPTMPETEPESTTSRPQPATPSAAPNAEQPDTEGHLSPYEWLALVMRQTSGWTFDICVDRGDGGTYREGDAIQIDCRSAEQGYLYLFHLSPSGQLASLQPETEPVFRIEPASTTRFSAQRLQFPLLLQESGPHEILAVVTQRKLSPAMLLRVFGRNGTAPHRQHAAESAQLTDLARRCLHEGPDGAQSLPTVDVGPLAVDRSLFFVKPRDPAQE